MGFQNWKGSASFLGSSACICEMCKLDRTEVLMKFIGETIIDCLACLSIPLVEKRVAEIPTYGGELRDLTS